MQLYLIRHAQSQNNARPLDQRVEDPSITQLGQKQTIHLADWIRSEDLTRLICSPFLRALQTTDSIYASTCIVPEVWIDLHEQGGCVSGPRPNVMQGEPGMSRSDINSRFPSFHVEDRINGAGWWLSRPYETIEEARRRADILARRTRDEFARTHERVAYVTHGTLMLLLIESLFPEIDSLDELHNTSITKMIISSNSNRLEYINQVDHLPDELVT